MFTWIERGSATVRSSVERDRFLFSEDLLLVSLRHVYQPDQAPKLEEL
jgi:hypothetical protein